MSDEEPDSVLLPYLGTEIAVAIANAISAWAYFEYQIDEVTWTLAGLEPAQGACLTAQFQTVATRLDALIALARVQKIPASHISKLNGVRAEALKLSPKRNRLVHDPWFFGYSTQAYYRLQQTAKSILDRGYKEVSVTDINDFEQQIKNLTTLFHEASDGVLTAFLLSP